MDRRHRFTARVRTDLDRHDQEAAIRRPFAHGVFLIHIIGFGFIALLLAMVALFPRSEWTQALLTTYGVRGTGPNGRMRRRDHLRGALVSLVLTACCASASLLAFDWAGDHPAMSRTNWTLSAYGFGFFLLAGVSLLAAGGAVWRSVLPPGDESEREIAAEVDESVT